MLAGNGEEESSSRLDRMDSEEIKEYIESSLDDADEGGDDIDGVKKLTVTRDILLLLDIEGRRGDDDVYLVFSILKEVLPFQPTRGGKHIKKDMSQTTKMTNFARFPVIIERYCTGRVTAR